MNILDLLRLRFGFYKLIYIRPTDFCPLHCRHCCGNFGPGGAVTANVSKLKHWVSSVGSLGQVEWIGIEGGEPFAVLPELSALLEMSGEWNISTAVLTSAFWAESKKRSIEILKRIPKVSFLIISTDEFHEEYVPLKKVLYALEAAISLGIDRALQVCLGPGHDAFIKRLQYVVDKEILKNVHLIKTPLQKVGRAEDICASDASGNGDTLPDGNCLFLGTPVIRENGDFLACCQQQVIHAGPLQVFRLGNMADTDLREIKECVNTDLYFQTLRCFGPKAIAMEALKQHWGWQPRKGGYHDICELCRDLAGNNQVVNGFRSHCDSGEYREMIALARLAFYGETAVE